jgi:hypothetical protein
VQPRPRRSRIVEARARAWARPSLWREHRWRGASCQTGLLFVLYALVVAAFCDFAQAAAQPLLFPTEVSPSVVRARSAARAFAFSAPKSWLLKTGSVRLFRAAGGCVGANRGGVVLVAVACGVADRGGARVPRR